MSECEAKQKLRLGIEPVIKCVRGVKKRDQPTCVWDTHNSYGDSVLRPGELLQTNALLSSSGTGLGGSEYVVCFP